MIGPADSVSSRSWFSEWICEICGGTDTVDPCCHKHRTKEWPRLICDPCWFRYGEAPGENDDSDAPCSVDWDNLLPSFEELAKGVQEMIEELR